MPPRGAGASIIERAPRNGTPIGRLGGQSRASWPRTQHCATMSRSVSPERSRTLTASASADPMWYGRADRKSVVEGKRVSVRVDLGGRRIIKKKKEEHTINNNKQ